MGRFRKIPKYIMAIGEHLNAESTAKQFAEADVYDGTHGGIKSNSDSGLERER